MQQLVDRLDTVTEDARRFRRDRLRTITVHADVEQDLTFELLERIKHRVEAALKPNLAAHPGHDPEPRFESRADTVPIVEADTIPLKGKPGYFIGWGGEAERSAELRTLLWFAIPPYFGLMLLMLILQFSDLRQPLIILLTVPLSMVGITAGLLLTGQPFGFMSLLGILVLSGILIRNAILLLHRSDLEIHPGEPRLETILRAVSSPLRPIGLAASTSILAFLPLLRDELFASMAVTVIAGLVVGTLLSLVMVPVLYAILFAIQNEEAV
jgi:multidrug efflux pump subunit AcrB